MALEHSQNVQDAALAMLKRFVTPSHRRLESAH